MQPRLKPVGMDFVFRINRTSFEMITWSDG